VFEYTIANGVVRVVEACERRRGADLAALMREGARLRGRIPS
jgi:hypothetical protein